MDEKERIYAAPDPPAEDQERLKRHFGDLEREARDDLEREKREAERARIMAARPE